MSVFSTNEQQHYFNCPFQLGMGSDDTPADADYYILTDISVGDVVGESSSDEPVSTLISPPTPFLQCTPGESSNHKRETPPAVMATDGVWDNVYEEDVVRLVVEGRCQPRRISGLISKLSQRQARDGGYMSPFAFSARRQGLSYSGGKLDDVTVVVARVAVSPIPSIPHCLPPPRASTGCVVYAPALRPPDDDGHDPNHQVLPTTSIPLDGKDLWPVC